MARQQGWFALLLALAFAARSLNRTRLEKSLLLKMWEENMTIKKAMNVKYEFPAYSSITYLYLWHYEACILKP